MAMKIEPMEAGKKCVRNQGLIITLVCITFRSVYLGRLLSKLKATHCLFQMKKKEESQLTRFYFKCMSMRGRVKRRALDLNNRNSFLQGA